MTYQLAYAAAEMDAMSYRGEISIEDDFPRHRLLLRVEGQIVGAYPYRA